MRQTNALPVCAVTSESVHMAMSWRGRWRLETRCLHKEIEHCVKILDMLDPHFHLQT